MRRHGRPVIVHHLPGRVRLSVPGIYRRPGAAEALEDRLLAMPGVLGTRANAYTARVLVHYDPARTTARAVLEAVDGQHPEHVTGVPSEPSGRGHPRDPDAAAGGPGLDVVAPAVLLAALGGRRLVAGPSPASRLPWVQTASAAVGVVSAYPALREGLRSMGRGRLNTDFVLTAASVALLLARESIPGLLILWLLNLSRWAERSALARAQRAIRVAGEAAGEGDPLGRMADDPPSRFTPGPFLLAGSVLALTRDPVRALAVLVAASPRARDLAVAVTRANATAAAVRMGVFPRSAAAVEAAGRADVAVLEAPALLAQAEPRVTGVVSLHPDYPEARVLALAATALGPLGTPVAAALQRAAREAPSQLEDAPESAGGEAAVAEVVPGQGVVARAGRQRVLAGTAALLESHGVSVRRARLHALRLEARGEDVLYVAVGRRLTGVIGIWQEARPEAVRLAHSLRTLGVLDLRALPAGPLPLHAGLARRLGLEPEPHAADGQGCAAVERLQAQGRTVLAVGAGPGALGAVRAARAGVAPAGSPAAAAAHVVTAGGDLERVAALVHLGQTAMEIRRQNEIIATAFMAAGLALAVSGTLSLGAALLLQDVACLSILANARRLLGSGPVPLPNVRNVDPAVAAGAAHPAVATGVPASSRAVRPAGLRLDLRPAPGRPRPPGPPMPPPIRGGSGLPPEPGRGLALAVNPLPWHTLDAAEVERHLRTSLRWGLSPERAERRLARYGPNTLAEARPPSLLRLFARQFQDLMVLTLIGASGVALGLGAVKDALSILAILLVNAAFGVAQEYHTSRSVAALRRLAAPTATVIRGGTLEVIPASRVVPGDVIHLEAGNRVPADARLVEVQGLEVEESSLTGESLPVRKQVDPLEGRDLTPGDRTNMVFMGTSVTRGRGRAVVVGTGMSTEMGRILALLEEAEDAPTPLQRRLDDLGRVLLGASVAVAGSVLGIGLLRGQPLLPMFMTGVSLAVAAIPEGLPAVVTIALASGVRRMVRQKAIARRLSAIETLGMVSVVCSDKTGTMTCNEMQVRAVYAGERYWDVTPAAAGPWRVEAVDGPWQALAAEAAGPDARDGSPADAALAVAAAAACSDGDPIGPCPLPGLPGEAGAALVETVASSDPSGEEVSSPGIRGVGDPLDAAVRRAAAALAATVTGHAISLPGHERVAEVPFDPDRRRVTVALRAPDGQAWLVTKGAPDVVIPLCTSVYRQGHEVPLGPARAAAVHAACERMTGQALRVVAVAGRPLGDGAELRGDGLDAARLAEQERDLTLLGLIGMMDPPRPGVAAAIERATRAGVRILMVTGDHPDTAAAVARELGLFREEGRILTGAEIDAMSDDALRAALPTVQICARVAPRHKLRIVRALRQAGHVVAMTGDGVNDAPAVKEADVGIAMGRGGTDTTREASSLILTDDNFATLVMAVEEGRGVRANIRKALGYLMAGNSGEVVVMLLGAAAGLPMLLPIQLLLVNILSDSLPALVLATGRPEPDSVEGPPVSPDESLFSRGLAAQILARGAAIGLGTLGMYAWGLRTGDIARARSLALASLVLNQWAQVPDWQFEGQPHRYPQRRRDPWLVGSVTVSSLLLPALFHVPALAGIFQTVPLSAADWLRVTGASAVVGGVSRMLGRLLSGSQRPAGMAERYAERGLVAVQVP